MNANLAAARSTRRLERQATSERNRVERRQRAQAAQAVRRARVTKVRTDAIQARDELHAKNEQTKAERLKRAAARATNGALQKKREDVRRAMALKAAQDESADSL